MSQPQRVDLDAVDLANIDLFAAEGGPWGMFETLRHEDPVHWTPEEEPNSGFWAVTKYNDIWEVEKDAETYSSEAFVNLEEVALPLRDARRSILETDGPRHQALRSLVQREFSPRNLMKNYEGFLRELTRETMDAALQHDEFDFIEDISADLPIQVLARLLDVPRSDTPQLIAWGNELVANTDPDFTDHRIDLPESVEWEHLPFRSPTVKEVWDYGRKLKAERLGGEGTDLLSILANKLPSDGIPLTDLDFDNYFSLLVIAGNETTRHAISNIMYGLLSQPDQLKLLMDDPSLIDTGLEELLRWASPVYHFRRTATRDTELGGKRIKEGDKVVMWFASGNRDEEVFEDPYKIDVTRKNVDNMTFGKGSPHLCLGNNLARMEIRLVFEELLPRLKSIELAGEPKRIRSNFVNGMKAFPVAITRK